MRTEPTVFIVDDDKAMRDGVSLLVKSVGLQAKSFADAQDFLDYYSDSEPGCVVLDVRMPGMSGIELHISVRGAAFHRAHILEKMEAGSLVELAQEVSKLDGTTGGAAIEADGFIGLRRS